LFVANGFGCWINVVGTWVVALSKWVSHG
jgi:hypothetical protein